MTTAIIDSLKSLGDFILGKRIHQDLDIVNFLRMLEDTILSVNTILDTRKSQDTFYTDLSAYIKDPSRYKPTTPHDKEFVKLYKRYKDSLSHELKTIEENAFLESIYKVLTEHILPDLNLIRSHYKSIFSSRVPVADVKISHTYIVGYLVLTGNLVDFYTSLLFLVNLNKDNTVPPKYHIGLLNKFLDATADFVSTVNDRNTGYTILTELDHLRKGQDDLAVTVDGLTIDKYSNGLDYSKEVSTVVTHGFLGVTIMISDYFARRSKLKYDKNVAVKEWLQAKIQHLALEMNKKDPEDPEYIRLSKIIDYYTNTITRLDKEIQEYEEG